MEEYLFDDSVYKIDNIYEMDSKTWNNFIRVEHLDNTKTYKNILCIINDMMDPRFNLELSLSYESMKLLIEQARQYNIPFINSDLTTAYFILSRGNQEIEEKLLIEEGFLEPKKTASIVDSHIYKRIYDVLSENNDMEEIKKERNKFISTIFDTNGLYLDILLDLNKYCNYTFYFLDRNDYELIDYKDTAKYIFLDLISFYLFDDFYENIAIDINQMFKYIKLTDNDFIPDERISFYNKFLDIGKEDWTELNFSFNKIKEIKPQSLIEQFYDDIRMLKNDSYKSLVDSCTVFTKESSLYNKHLSDKYGCDIYYLDGEPFYGFVRSNVKVSKHRIKTDDNGKLYSVFDSLPSNDEAMRAANSFSYIGKDNINTYMSPNTTMTLFYTGIDFNSIVHVYHNDSFSSKNWYYCSDFPNELHTPDSILRESNSYSEIFVSNIDGVKPSALLCLDNVSEWDIEFSKTYGLPIVVINTEKYKRNKNNISEETESNHYLM